MTSHHREWFLNSRDKDGNTTPENCIIPHSTMVNGHLRSVHLKSFTMPYMVHNITSAKGNNTITIGDNLGADTTVTIPDGYYTFTHLMNTLNALIITAFPVGLLTAASFVFDGNNYNVDFTASGTLFQLKTTTLATQLGFDSTQLDTNQADGSTITGSSHPDLLETQNIYVIMPGISNSHYPTHDIRSETLACIPVSVAFGNTITYSPVNFQEKLLHRQLNNFHIRLVDDTGTELVNHGFHWNMVLVCHYVNTHF